MMREIIDTAASEGYETEEVSYAKNEVMDLFEWRDDLFDFNFDPDTDEMITIVRDSIHTADVIVELLIEMGWRPTRENHS